MVYARPKIAMQPDFRAFFFTNLDDARYNRFGWELQILQCLPHLLDQIDALITRPIQGGGKQELRNRDKAAVFAEC